MTPPRQVWLFQLGCWLAFATASLHLVGHLFVAGDRGPAQMPDQTPASPPYLFLIYGQSVPTIGQTADGLSLSLSLLLATLGGAGLVVARRGQNDPVLLRGVARPYAIGSALLLVISVLTFFSLQTFAIAMMAVCFALGTVSET